MIYFEDFVMVSAVNRWVPGLCLNSNLVSELAFKQATQQPL